MSEKKKSFDKNGRTEIRITVNRQQFQYFEDLRHSLGEKTHAKAVIKAVQDYNRLKDRVIFLEAENGEYARINGALLEVIEIKRKMQ